MFEIVENISQNAVIKVVGVGGGGGNAVRVCAPCHPGRRGSADPLAAAQERAGKSVRTGGQKLCLPPLPVCAGPLPGAGVPLAGGHAGGLCG